MKYLKAYNENNSGLYCWRITTHYPEYIISLKKIDMDQAHFNEWKDLFEDDFQGYIYIFKSVYYDGSYEWSWSTSEYPYALGETQNTIYMGDVDIDASEIQAYKYNL
jgi:hypothetical protein